MTEQEYEYSLCPVYHVCMYIYIQTLQMVTRGDLLISLKHNPATKKLEGFLLKATNLQKQDIVGLAGNRIYLLFVPSYLTWYYKIPCGLCIACHALRMPISEWRCGLLISLLVSVEFGTIPVKRCFHAIYNHY